jgi:C-terminal processing protease CtpA/Prc
MNLTEDAKNNYRFYNLPYGSLDTLTELYATRDKFLDKKYLGKCYLAINGTSISASVDCASWFRQINRGVILGEPCMGPLTGTCGNPISFSLKNTGIEVLTSTMRSYTKPRFVIQNEAIIPDVVLKNTLGNFRQKKDVVYEYLIKNEK